MTMVRATVVIATDGPVAKYGGVRLAPEALERMAVALNRGDVPINVEHDPRQPASWSNVVARVEEIARGHLGVVVEFDIEADAWAEIQSGAADAGAPGGFSFVSVTPVAELGPDTTQRILIAAEYGEFTESDLIDSVNPLARHVHVQAGSLFQFSALEELAKIIIDLGPGVVASLGPELVGAALYDSVRHLLRRKQRPGKTMIDLRIEEVPGERRTQAVIVTDDPEVAAGAVADCLDKIDQLGGVVDYDVDSGEWRTLKDQESPDASSD